MNAFKEVKDYLISSRQLAEQVQSHQLAARAAQRNESLATTRYKTRIDTYLNVLTAQNSLHNSRQTLATLKTSQMTSAVQPTAALSGGWDTEEVPTEKEVVSKRWIRLPEQRAFPMEHQ